MTRTVTRTVATFGRAVAILAGWLRLSAWAAAAQTVPLSVQVQDVQGQDVPCRVHLWDAQGQPQRAPGLPFWHDHFVCSGRAQLELPPGDYRYLVERGPEYARLEGPLQLAAASPAQLSLVLRRVADLRQQGWYAADLHVHRPVEQLELLMRAEDLDLAPLITWWNTRNYWSDRKLPDRVWQPTTDGRWLSLTAGEDEREGGALLYFGLREPLDIAHATREVPSPLTYVNLARQQQPDVWIDIEKPFWWDVPVWLASGQMQSVGLANNHMCRDRMLADEAWGKPRDVQRLPPPRGNGFWTQEIYYQILNTGLRIPPSAGSASGVLPNPVGYNRVYVHLDEPMSADGWWRGLRSGACFVTNGPLLICQANGQWPGSVLSSERNQPLAVRLQLRLTTRDPIDRLEVIHNGAVWRQLDVAAAADQALECELSFDTGGWFLVRAIAQVSDTFRFASTGPFYLERPGEPPYVRRDAVEFFQAWVDERIARVKANVSDPRDQAAVLQPHEAARQFWQTKAAGTLRVP